MRNQKKKKQFLLEEAEEVSEALIKFQINKYFKILILFIGLFFGMGTNQKINTNLNAMAAIVSLDYMYALSVKCRANTQLILEVENYISRAAPGSKIDATHLVNICQEYDLDVIFVLAQGILESHFGTKGKAAVTNSVFNVGTYDDGQILYTYNNPNKSIEPYAQLLNNRYLNDKEILDLLQDKGYVNADGKRFATEIEYEARLRNYMINIDMRTSISMLQGIRDLNESEILLFFGPLKEQPLYTQK